MLTQFVLLLLIGSVTTLDTEDKIVKSTTYESISNYFACTNTISNSKNFENVILSYEDLVIIFCFVFFCFIEFIRKF